MTGTATRRCWCRFENPTELWLTRDHKHDLVVRPLEAALEKGAVDAIYTQSKYFQHLQEATGKYQGDRGSVAVSGLDAAVVQPARRLSPVPT